MFKRSQLWTNPKTGTTHKEGFTIFESPRELADAFRDLSDDVKRGREGNEKWCGVRTAQEVQNYLNDGRASLVAPSDALLNAFDDVAFVSRRSSIVAAVSGGAPNVGAFLAGSPMAMRQRVRTLSDAAPLRVVADISSSGGIDKDQLTKRGTAILALVRMLSAVRPVELYCGFSCFIPNSTMEKGDALYLLTRIDTAPMDLIRAAYLLADASAARFAGYALASCIATNGKDNHNTQWAYNNHNTSRDRAPHAIAHAFGDGGEVLYLAPPYIDDKSINDPIAFVREKLIEFGGAPVADAA